MFARFHTVCIIVTFSLFFKAAVLNASGYDNDILDIFSKTLPRFILMSSQKENIKGDLEICILHDEIDELTALSLIEKVNENYPNGIKDYQIRLTHSNYATIDLCQNSQLAFMFNTSKENINKALSFSFKHSVLSVSYDEKLLHEGVALSMFLGRKVTPYINIHALRKNGIELNNMLLRISKIYEGGHK
jgi:hypothetical protein